MATRKFYQIIYPHGLRARVGIDAGMMRVRVGRSQPSKNRTHGMGLPVTGWGLPQLPVTREFEREMVTDLGAILFEFV